MLGFPNLAGEREGEGEGEGERDTEGDHEFMLAPQTWYVEREREREREIKDLGNGWDGSMTLNAKHLLHLQLI